MANPTLPVDMIPLINGYSVGGPGGVVRSEVGGGNPLYALEYEGGVQAFNVSFALKPLLYQIWVMFFHKRIAKGAIPFDMPLDSGTGVVPHACRIVPGTYNAVRNGFHHIVAFQVEAVNSIDAMDDTYIDQILGNYEFFGSEKTMSEWARCLDLGIASLPRA